MPSTIGRSAFSCSSENARMVPALSPETTTQITVKSSQSFVQSGSGLTAGNNCDPGSELGDEAPHFHQLVVGAIAFLLELLARGVDEARFQQERRIDARLQALLAVGKGVEQLVERAERDAELEVLGLDAFFQRDGVAQPQVVAMRGARHVAAERCAARRGLAL